MGQDLSRHTSSFLDDESNHSLSKVNQAFHLDSQSSFAKVSIQLSNLFSDTNHFPNATHLIVYGLSDSAMIRRPTRVPHGCFPKLRVVTLRHMTADEVCSVLQHLPPVVEVVILTDITFVSRAVLVPSLPKLTDLRLNMQKNDVHRCMQTMDFWSLNPQLHALTLPSLAAFHCLMPSMSQVNGWLGLKQVYHLDIKDHGRHKRKWATLHALKTTEVGDPMRAYEAQIPRLCTLPNLQSFVLCCSKDRLTLEANAFLHCKRLQSLRLDHVVLEYEIQEHVSIIHPATMPVFASVTTLFMKDVHGDDGIFDELSAYFPSLEALTGPLKHTSMCPKSLKKLHVNLQPSPRNHRCLETVFADQFPSIVELVVSGPPGPRRRFILDMDGSNVTSLTCIHGTFVESADELPPTLNLTLQDCQVNELDVEELRASIASVTIDPSCTIIPQVDDEWSSGDEDMDMD